MPELPEVETVRLGLAQAITGTTIESVTLRRRDLRSAFPAGFAAKLAGRTIRSIGRRAKYLLFTLDSGDVVIAHLGMTGRFSVEPAQPKKLSAHDHVLWHLEDGRCVLFNDARRFGLMTLSKTSALDKHPLLKHLGPEPLEKAFSPSRLKSLLSGKKAPIKAALMDQRLVVGIGNIYASEALFLAGIDPRRVAHKAASKADALHASIQRVLRDALASGGSSLRDFMHVSGETGAFQHHFNVYDREGEPCFHCRTPIISTRQSGRSTYYCKRCQK